MKTKTLAVYSAIILASMNSGTVAANGCGPDAVTKFTKSVAQAVYDSEKVIIKADDMVKLLDNPPKYSLISDVKNCDAMLGVQLLTDNCVGIFDNVASYAELIAADKIVRGTDLPEEVYDFYVSYKVPNLKVDYASLEAFDRSVDAGYQSYMESIVKIVKECNKLSKVETHSFVNLDSVKPGKQIAFIDVYKNSEKRCSFVAEVVAGKVSFEVPAQLRSCVTDADLVAADIRGIDATTGGLIRKAVLNNASEFVVKDPSEKSKVVASSQKVEEMENLEKALVSGGEAKVSTTISRESYNFDKIDVYNDRILKVVAICEWGVDPDNYKKDLDEWFLADWNDATYRDNNTGETLVEDLTKFSAANSKSNRGYLLGLYWNQLINMSLYPRLAELHMKLEAGKMSYHDLWNWRNEGHILCYKNYPSTWVRSYVFDYLKTGYVDYLKLDEWTIKSFTDPSILINAPVK